MGYKNSWANKTEKALNEGWNLCFGFPNSEFPGKNTFVEVILRSGSYHDGDMNASSYNWEHNGGSGDIIAWRYSNSDEWNDSNENTSGTDDDSEYLLEEYGECENCKGAGFIEEIRCSICFGTGTFNGNKDI